MKGSSGLILPMILVLCAFIDVSEARVSIRSVAALPEKCAMVYGSLELGGDSFFVKDCVSSIQVVGRFELGFLEQLHFTSAENGWAVSGGNVIRLRLGGSEMIVDVVQRRIDKNYYHSVHFVDDTHGVAVGSHGVISTTSDGGSSWKTIRLGDTADFRYVSFLDSQFGWVLGQNRSGIGLEALFVTYDGGQKWVPVQTNGRSFENFEFRSRQEGCGIVSRKQIACLRSNGKWIDIVLPDEDRNGLGFKNERVGWMVGSSIVRSRDGGLSWKAVYRPKNDHLNLDGFVFAGERTAWVWGIREVLLTIDDGSTWINRFSDIEKLVLSKSGK